MKPITMSDDIPQDQVEAVAKALFEHERAEAQYRPGHYLFRHHDQAQVQFEDLGPRMHAEFCSEASAAIRVLTPMIAEQCAEIADAYATAARAYATGDQEATYVGAARSIAFEIRSVKGAVT